MYVSFTDDHTRWTHLQLLATKDGVFEAYRNFEAWAKLQFQTPGFKIQDLIEEGSSWGRNLVNTFHHKVPNDDSLYMIPPNIMGYQKGSTERFLNERVPYYTQVSFPKTYGEKL